MTREEFEIKLIEDLVKGIDDVYDYLTRNIGVLTYNKDYFREYFLNDPSYAYCYAKYVDKCPREYTRKGACKDTYSYWYARFVDKCPREDTFNGVKGSTWERSYLWKVGKPS